MNKGLRYYAAYLHDKRLLKAAGVSESDVVLASFPKSGNTWLRYILARALYPEELIAQHNLLQYFPTVYKSTAEEMRKLPSPRFIKTHAAFMQLYPRCIYLVRDYRAVAVSGWFHAKNKAGYTGTLEEFMRGPLNNVFGPWHWHVNEALKRERSHPEKILLLQYETMLSEPEQTIERVLGFANIQPIVPVAEIARKTAFPQLQQLEKSDAHNPEQLFFRSGTRDDWKNHLTPELEAKLIDAPTRTILQRCGYLAQR